jgi:hypothetical protein
MKEMKDISRRLKKGPLEVQEYGRQQLQGMLSVGPYAYLQVPTPACSARLSEDNSAHAMEWKRTAVKECEVSILKVCAITCKIRGLEHTPHKSTLVREICQVASVFQVHHASNFFFSGRIKTKGPACTGDSGRQGTGVESSKVFRMNLKFNLECHHSAVYKGPGKVY